VFALGEIERIVGRRTKPEAANRETWIERASGLRGSSCLIQPVEVC
jgi:hypothetical protein